MVLSASLTDKTRALEKGARFFLAKPYQGVRVCYAGEREDWVQAMVSAGLGMTVMPEFLPILPGIEMRLIVEPEVYRQVSLVN